MTAHEKHVFISYSRANKAFVNRLITRLQEEGLNIWIDKQGLKPGTRNWEQALRDAINGSYAVLLVASPASRRSAYVNDELAIAEMFGRRVYPVWGDGEQWMDSIPMGMGKIQFIDARGEAFETGIDDIVDALILAIDKGLGQGVIQIGPDHCTSIRELAETLVKISNKDIEIEYDLSKPEGDRGRCADYSKAREVLGWKPRKTLDEGLREIYDWVGQQLESPEN